MAPPDITSAPLHRIETSALHRTALLCTGLSTTNADSSVQYAAEARALSRTAAARHLRQSREVRAGGWGLASGGSATSTEEATAIRDGPPRPPRHAPSRQGGGLAAEHDCDQSAVARAGHRHCSTVKPPTGRDRDWRWLERTGSRLASVPVMRTSL